MGGIVDWSQIRQTMLLATHRIEFYDPSYWDKEANVVNQNMARLADLTKKQVKKMSIDSEFTVLDVGAGTGRMTFPMAQRAKHVTALEPSENMLTILRDNARKQHIFNIHYINKSLEDLDTTTSYDVVVASFSLFMLDIEKAIVKMNALASKRVYLFLSATPWMDAIHGSSGSWSDFIIVYNVLYETGIFANVDICDFEFKQSYEDLEDAVSKYAQIYSISLDKKDKLREYLSVNLVKEKGKIWDNRKRKAAMIWWTTNK
jgi:SAM-dependent methyltransferase